MKIFNCRQFVDGSIHLLKDLCIITFIKAEQGLGHSVIYTDDAGQHFRYYGGTFACLLVIASSFASVFVKAGNIYYSQGGQEIQLTNTNQDNSPILSPNKKLIAFIRTGHQIIPQKCLDFSAISSKYGNQIWIYNIANKTERLLVDNNFSCNKPKKRIVDPQQLHFSPNSKTLYFVTSAWAVSGAVHAINVDGTNYRFIQPANELEVITSGEYQGYLALQQHRYFIGGGSYDWYWLFTPELADEICNSIASSSWFGLLGLN